MVGGRSELKSLLRTYKGDAVFVGLKGVGMRMITNSVIVRKCRGCWGRDLRDGKRGNSDGRHTAVALYVRGRGMFDWNMPTENNVGEKM